MESWVFKYVGFLLTSHNCVIIPHLGAFIIDQDNLINVDATSTDGLFPPKYSLIFNQDLKHNDGLLSSFIQKHEGVSYQASCKKIKQAVSSIKIILHQEGYIQCENIGKFILNENQSISFIPNRHHIYPLSFGLSPIYLKHLIDIDILAQDRIKENKKNRYYISRIVATAALVLLFVTPSFNLTNLENNSRISQQANFSKLFKNIENIKSGHTTTKDAMSTTYVTNIEVEEKAPIINIDEDEDAVLQPQAQKNSHRTYYIILGSDKSETNINSIKTKIKIDFPDITVLEDSGRYRLFSASFDNKNEAEQYLAKLRNDYPKYKTAWLYSKRNN